MIHIGMREEMKSSKIPKGVNRSAQKKSNIKLLIFFS